MNLTSLGKQTKLLILWGTVFLFGLSSLFGWVWLHDRIHEQIFTQKLRETQIANDAFAEHTEQVFRNVDLALSAVREVYQRTQSMAETESLIASLPLNRPLVENIYLIDAQGRIALSPNPAYQGTEVQDRDYFVFHQQSSQDELHIGSVAKGRVTKEYLFRVTRRISKADGSFGGVVLVALRPHAFSDYYRRLNDDAEGLTSLIGIEDKKIRARTPEPSNDAWQIPLQGMTRDLLEKNLSGHSRAKSRLDGIEREFVYRRVGEFPLVLVSAFSNRDVDQAVIPQIRPITIAGIAAVIFSIILAAILTIVFRQREEMNRLATVDVLTGLLSRRHFMLLAERELSRSVRYKSEMSVLMIDIDNFKTVNDTHGHEAGDRVLRRLGEILASVLRDVDFVGRIGGEEFAVVLPQTPILRAFEVAERLRRTVEHVEIPLTHGLPLSISISIGVSSLHDRETNIDTFLGQADRALYDAKRQGRNQVSVYEITLFDDSKPIVLPETQTKTNAGDAD